MKHHLYIVHGILGEACEYIPLRKALRKAGFDTTIFAYKSRKEGVLEVGKMLYERVKKDNFEQVSFISHSLGGLILRAMLSFAQNDAVFPAMHRVVMIAPPNAGTISGNFLYKYSIFRRFFGVNLRHVKNDSYSLARTLPVQFPCEVGIIAGGRGNKTGYNPLIGDDNDMEIRPEETKLGTENDFVLVKAVHIFILQNKNTVRQTVHFLNTGRFARN